jgi:hypothetical protein
VVSLTHRLFYPQGKSPWYLLHRKLGGPIAVLEAAVRRKIPSFRRKSNPRTLTPISTELSRLSCVRHKCHKILTRLLSVVLLSFPSLMPDHESFFPSPYILFVYNHLPLLNRRYITSVNETASLQTAGEATTS